MDKLALYQACFLHNPTPKLLLQRDNFRIIEGNASAAELFECGREDMGGLELDSLIPDRHCSLTELLRHALATQQTFFTFTLERPADRILHIEAYPAPLGETDILSIVFIDASARRYDEAKLAAIMREADIGIAMARTEDGIIIECNPAMEKMLERERIEIIGQSQAIMHPDEPLQEGKTKGFAEHCGSNTDAPVQQKIITKRGKLIDVEIKAQRFNLDGETILLGFFQDITRRLELETQLRQRYKMEAVGVMAAGIAHNFNNSLGIIMNSLEMARISRDDPARLELMLNNARTGGLRIRDLVQQILTYTRNGRHTSEPVQLGIVLDETTNLLRATIPNSVRIVTAIDVTDSGLMVEADAGRIQEALLNLCSNAVRAMDEKGTLKISTAREDLSPAHQCNAALECSPGPHVRVRVEDSGCGIPDAIMEKMFDPFYSSRGQEQNLGMGLSTVMGIVKQHRGCIRVESSPEKGSCFDLFFPLMHNDSEDMPTDEDIRMPRGKENILFVDDEEILVDMGVMMLEELGYQATGMSDSTEALRLFEANPDHFDLVITDQTMPDMTGLELIDALRRIHPQIPTIVCTGFSTKIDHTNAADLGVQAFILKPLELPTLAGKIREALQGADK
ncbi:MAG: ATP-binding protein [Desulfuromonadaceae bacterium]